MNGVVIDDKIVEILKETGLKDDRNHVPNGINGVEMMIF